jgi:hypothetical protein
MKQSSACRLAGILILASWIVCCDAANGDVLEETKFLRGPEGWTISVEGGKGKTKIDLEHDKGMKRIVGGEQGDVLWYFVAPAKVRKHEA